MSSKVVGKVIEDIYIGKKKVVLKFVDDKLSIPLDVYTKHYFYKGKTLTSDELKDIYFDVRIEKYLSYAKKLLSSSLYCEQAIRNKLVKKEANTNEINYVIKTLKDNHLIDDEEYVKAVLSSLTNKKYGKERINKYLASKGVDENMLRNLSFSYEEEYNRAIALLPFLEKKYSSYNQQTAKNKIYNSLIRYGYSHDVAVQALSEFKIRGEENEMKLLKRDYLKALKKYSSKIDDKISLDKKIVNYLLGKGYKYKDIKKLKESAYEDRMD